MSKTVEELIGVYIEASNAVEWEAEKRGLCPMTLDMQRAGIAAIVRALRDEIFDARGNASYGSLAIYEMFNQILADAGEKVADIGGAFEGLMDGLAKACATAPAPAVCVWVKGETGGVRPSCSDIYEYAPYVVREGVCPECKAPIKFTEAK